MTSDPILCLMSKGISSVSLCMFANTDQMIAIVRHDDSNQELPNYVFISDKIEFMVYKKSIYIHI